MQKVSLVLSSGGARGMAHIGVIEELLSNDFEIAAIAGSSIGALIGGIYAQGKLDEYKKWVSELDKFDVFKLMDFTFTQQGIIKGDKVFQEMSHFINNKPIEELNIPFAAVATDLLNHREVVFTSGSLFDALRASIAIPTILTPHKYKNNQLVDGGVFNPLPVNHVKRQKGDLLVVVDLNAPSDKKAKKNKKESNPEQGNYFNLIKEKIQSMFSSEEEREEKLNYFNFINKTLDVMQVRISGLLLEQYKPDILVTIPRNACGTFDYHRAEEMIELGKTEFLKSLSSFQNGK
jgi:NTE family protein